MKNGLTSVLLAFAAFGVTALPMVGHAQNYPNRSISVVVPFPAGGPSDVVARIVTEHMGRTLGQQMVIENVAGAGGTLGSARVAAAQPQKQADRTQHEIIRQRERQLRSQPVKRIRDHHPAAQEDVLQPGEAHVDDRQYTGGARDPAPDSMRRLRRRQSDCQQHESRARQSPAERSQLPGCWMGDDAGKPIAAA